VALRDVGSGGGGVTVPGGVPGKDTDVALREVVSGEGGGWVMTELADDNGIFQH